MWNKTEGKGGKGIRTRQARQESLGERKRRRRRRRRRRRKKKGC